MRRRSLRGPLGDVGVSTACAVYTVRPDVFKDCLPGDDACQTARRRFNLSESVTPCPQEHPRAQLLDYRFGEIDELEFQCLTDRAPPFNLFMNVESVMPLMRSPCPLHKRSNSFWSGD